MAPENPRPDTREISSYLKSFLTDPNTTGNIPISRHQTADEGRAVSRSRAVSLGPSAEQVLCAITEGRGVATVVGICFVIPSTCELIMSNVGF